MGKALTVQVNLDDVFDLGIVSLRLQAPPAEFQSGTGAALGVASGFRHVLVIVNGGLDNDDIAIGLVVVLLNTDNVACPDEVGGGLHHAVEEVGPSRVALQSCEGRERANCKRQWERRQVWYATSKYVPCASSIRASHFLRTTNDVVRKTRNWSIKELATCSPYRTYCQGAG